MNEQDSEQLTLFPGGSHVSHFPWPESKKGKRITVISGRKCYELSENLSLVGLLVKTYLESCELLDERFVKIWSVRDTLSPYLILKQRVLVPTTNERGCSLLPTPTTQEVEHPQVGLTETGRRKTKDGMNSHSLNLADTIRMFPTPTVGAGFCGGTGHFQHLQIQKTQGVITKEEYQSMSNGNGGQLNPTWVEWLMGFPLGWTDLNV